VYLLNKSIFMASLNRTLINTIATFLGRVSGQIFGLILGVLLARYLGPENYGKYSFVVSFCYIFVVISNFGMNDLYVRDISADRKLASKYLGASLIIKSFIVILSIATIFLTLKLLGYSIEMVLYAMIFSVHLFFITQINTITSIFTSYEKMEYNAYITIINGATGLLLVTAFIFLDQSLSHILFSRVATWFFGLIVGFYFINRVIGRPDFKINLSFLANIAKRAFPFLTIGLIHILYFKVDIIMLSKIKGDLYVGYYTPAANDLFLGLFIIPGTISTVVYPIFSRQYNESLEKMSASINFTTKILAILGVAISVGTFLLADKIIYLFFGPKYGNSVIILQIMSLAISFAFVRDPFGFGIASVGKEKFLMWMNAFFLVLNIILNAILIPLYSHVGAAITTVICIFLSLFLGFYVLKQEVKGIFLFRDFLKPIIAGSVMGCVVFMLREYHVLFTICVGALVYGVSILMIKTFDESEMVILKSLVRRK